jgi:hypothetical protein
VPTERELRVYWNRSPNANVGVLLGPVSRLVVVRPEDASRELPETVESRDGRGNRYLFFAVPRTFAQPLLVYNVRPWIPMPPSKDALGVWSWREGHSPAEHALAAYPGTVDTPSPRSEIPAPYVMVLDDVADRDIEWLWPGRIPLGKLTVLDGDPGLGKSTVLLDLAARLSRGAPMPDGTGGMRAAVTILSAEDNLADTIRPRLQVAGAELSRIHAVTAVRDDRTGNRPPIIPADLPMLLQVLEETESRLLILDPFVAFLGGVDSRKDQDVRRCLHRLAEVAEHTGCAMLLLRHLAKGRASNVLYRGTGSIGIIGAARSGLLVARDPACGQQRVLAVTKCNLADTPPALRFTLEQVSPGACRIDWQGPCDFSAADLLAPAPAEEENDRLEEATLFLKELLDDGPMPADECLRRAGSLRIREKTLRRAKIRLHIRSIRENQGASCRWLWMLTPPTKSSPCPTSASSAAWRRPPAATATAVSVTNTSSPAEAASTSPPATPSPKSANAASNG